MPPSALDFGSRAQLTELMDEPCTREVLRACLKDIARLNRWFLAYRPVLNWLNSLALPPHREPIHIVDVGCGYGDGLRRVEKWAWLRGINVELTGVDLNPDAAVIASDTSSATSRIQWKGTNVFSFKPSGPIHIVISSLFTHHLDDEEIVRFVRWMEKEARFGWFINDLSRNAIPYVLLKLFSRLAGLHPFVQHDGPVSIARAFIPADWRKICAEAGLNDNDVSIKGFAPARLCVGRRKQL